MNQKKEKDETNGYRNTNGKESDDEVAECQSSGMRVSAWCELLKEKVIHADETVVQVNPEERYTQRQEHSKKVLDGFYAWLET